MPQCLLSSDPTPSSRHMRVLVVEDSYLAARSLARMRQDLGAEVVGPAPSVQAAMSLIESKGCDAAVLDINLGSETVEPIARRLDDEGRPYFFISGYASPKTMLADPRFASRRLLSKPVEPVLLNRAVAEEFGLMPGDATNPDRG